MAEYAFLFHLIVITQTVLAGDYFITHFCLLLSDLHAMKSKFMCIKQLIANPFFQMQQMCMK